MRMLYRGMQPLTISERGLLSRKNRSPIDGRDSKKLTALIDP